MTAGSSLDAVVRHLRHIGGRLSSPHGTGLSNHIAEATGYNRRTINWALERLEQDGRVLRDIRGRRTYEIRLLEGADGEWETGRTSADSETRQRILDAARQLFKAHGYHGASMRSIGAAAGVTGPALYHYFEAKREVLAAVLFDLGDLMFADLARALGSDGSPSQPLERVLRGYIDVVSRHREIFPMVFSEFRNLSPADQRISSERRQYLLELWGGLVLKVRPDVDRDTAQVLALGAAWTIHSAGFVDLPLEGEDAKELLLNMAMTCVLATPTSGGGRGGPR